MCTSWNRSWCPLSAKCVSQMSPSLIGVMGSFVYEQLWMKVRVVVVPQWQTGVQQTEHVWMCAREVKIPNVLLHTETRFQVCIARPALIGELFTTEPSGKPVLLFQSWVPTTVDRSGSIQFCKHLPGTYYVPRSVGGPGKAKRNET